MSSSFLSSGAICLLWCVKALRQKWVHPCQLWHLMTHKNCVWFAWARSMITQLLLKWNISKVFLWKNSCLSLFLRELAQSSLPRRSGPASAEAKRWLRSRGSQMELADEFKRGMAISHSSVIDEGELLNEDVLSLTSSKPAASADLVSSHEDQDVAVEKDVVSESSQLERDRLDLAHSWLDRLYLSGHNCPALVILPFLPDLHAEAKRSWRKPYSKGNILGSECNHGSMRRGLRHCVLLLCFWLACPRLLQTRSGWPVIEVPYLDFGCTGSDVMGCRRPMSKNWCVFTHDSNTGIPHQRPKMQCLLLRGTMVTYVTQTDIYML